jgi:hypothetical protein
VSRAPLSGIFWDDPRKPKITAEQKKEIVEAVSSGRNTPAELSWGPPGESRRPFYSLCERRGF